MQHDFSNHAASFGESCCIFQKKTVHSKIKFFDLRKSEGKGRHSKYNFKAFTEKGLYMLATVLKSKKATRRNNIFHQLSIVIYSPENAGAKSYCP